jgi:hypothetical protein
MDPTTKGTNKKIDRRKFNGGPRAGCGRKKTGKKNATYFIPIELIEIVSSLENPSQFVEDSIRLKLSTL